MAAAFPFSITAAQVGTYFAGQYYQMLQQQPSLVHQFYSDTSTMVRGGTGETATGMLQIHRLIMSLKWTGYDIKTAHSLESWGGGILVMATGSVLMKDSRQKFVEIFFLAPQEKGYFVLSDIFQFIDEEPFYNHPAALLAHGNFDSKLNTSATNAEPVVPSYVLAGELQSREFVAPTHSEDNGPAEKYSFPEHQLPQGSENEIIEKNCTTQANGSHQNTVSNVHDPVQTRIEEPAAEPQKQTYASILRVSKAQASPVAQPTHNKNAPPVSEWHQVPQLNTQQQPNSEQPVASAAANGGCGTEAGDDVLAAEEEGTYTGEIKSVYVRNLPSSVSVSEIEEEFEKFGTLKPDGVVIRGRKDVGVCYAFVEFVDVTGVHNAIKASSVQIAGRSVYIEGRRGNSNIPYRGGRRGRGRGSYQNDASRGRYGARTFSGENMQDGGDRDYNRPRGNGYYRQTSRHDRGFSGNQASRSEQNLSESN